jgi:predicted ArsR family transcriptional regulator
METPPTPPEGDVLAFPVRARLFEALRDLRRPATTVELAAAVGRHPNTVRVQLGRLAEAGLIECRVVRRARGRPRQEWVVAVGAKPAGRPPEAHGALGRWLARALRRGGSLADIEAAGREIGHELAPASAGRPLAGAMHDALVAMGFAPRTQQERPDRLLHVLGNCPYRDAVRENPAAVCTLHRGITLGLLDRLGPGAKLVDFVARDPDAAGCLIEVAGAARAAG